ncbi:MAG: AraC-like DNA-binding protein [Glaciecola sp.]|jgi:AraC-like DNA-binding protein
MHNTIKDILDIGPNCYERFINSATLAEIKPLEIELAGCSNLSGRYCVARTTPIDHTLFYTLSGQGKLTTPNKQYDLTPHTLAILPAKQAFAVSIAAKHWDIFWINLANTRSWEHVALSEALVLDNQHLESLHLAMELLYAESNANLREGIMPILSHYLHTTLKDQAQHEQAQKTTNDRLHKLFEEVEKRLQFDWSIDAMCKHVHYSSPHLHRLCQAKFGRSPVQQLIFLRVQRAKTLLLNTRWPISHIASYVGYPNIFNFSKRFKKSVGVSPTEFRRCPLLI